MKKLYGVINAMTTPFNEDGSIDFDSLKKQVDYLIDKGVNCLYPLGTTGEMYLLTKEERMQIAETVVKQANHRVVVYIHVGAMTTQETCELAIHASKIGADGIGAVTPSYFSCSDRAIIQYYKDIAQSVPENFPIYLYSIPQCAANDIKPEVAAQLAKDCKNIIGIKYSYPDMLRILNYLQINDGDFSVLIGPDKLFYAGLCCGAKGVVSGVAGPMPEPFVALYKAFLENNHAKCKELTTICCKVADILRCGSDMAVFKNVLKRKGIIKSSTMRKPLLDQEENDAQQVWNDLAKYR